jgi:hypothetical protein
MQICLMETRKLLSSGEPFQNTRHGMKNAGMNETQEWNLKAATSLLQHGKGGEFRDCDRRIEPRCAGKIR